jgi:hypothetical protein
MPVLYIIKVKIFKKIKTPLLYDFTNVSDKLFVKKPKVIRNSFGKFCPLCQGHAPHIAPAPRQMGASGCLLIDISRLRRRGYEA